MYSFNEHVSVNKTWFKLTGPILKIIKIYIYFFLTEKNMVLFYRIPIKIHFDSQILILIFFAEFLKGYRHFNDDIGRHGKCHEHLKHACVTF